MKLPRGLTIEELLPVSTEIYLCTRDECYKTSEMFAMQVAESCPSLIERNVVNDIYLENVTGNLENVTNRLKW